MCFFFFFARSPGLEDMALDHCQTGFLPRSWDSPWQGESKSETALATAVGLLVVWTEEPHKQELSQVINVDSSLHPMRFMDTYCLERNEQRVGQGKSFTYLLEGCNNVQMCKKKEMDVPNIAGHD